MNNRFPNDHHQQQQQFYNNNSNNNFNHPDNYNNMHPDQQHPRYAQNRYDLKMNGLRESLATVVGKVVYAVVAYAAAYLLLNLDVEPTSVVIKPVILCGWNKNCDISIRISMTL